MRQKIKKLSVSTKILVAIALVFAMATWISVAYAQNIPQVHLQQEAVKNFYEETFPEADSMIIPSASDAVQVSATVLQNLHLSIVNGQPKYGTNWPYGATLTTDNIGSEIIIYTVTADY